MLLCEQSFRKYVFFLWLSPSLLPHTLTYRSRHVILCVHHPDENSRVLTLFDIMATPGWKATTVVFGCFHATSGCRRKQGSRWNSLQQCLEDRTRHQRMAVTTTTTSAVRAMTVGRPRALLVSMATQRARVVISLLLLLMVVVVVSVVPMVPMVSLVGLLQQVRLHCPWACL